MSPSQETDKQQTPLFGSLPEEKKRDLAQAYLSGGTQAVESRLPEMGITSRDDTENVVAVFKETEEIINGFNKINTFHEILLDAAKKNNGEEITPDVTSIDTPDELMYVLNFVGSDFFASRYYGYDLSKPVEMAIRVARVSENPSQAFFMKVVRELLKVIIFPSTPTYNLGRHIRAG